MGVRSGILLARGAEATAAALRGARETNLADGKPVEAIDQALYLLANALPESVPAGAGAAAGSTLQPERGRQAPTGAAAGAGAAFPRNAREPAAKPGVAAVDRVAELQESADEGVAATAARARLSAAEALEGRARAKAAGQGGGSPQGYGGNTSRKQSGSGTEKGSAGSRSAGPGHRGGRLGEKAGAPEYDMGMLNALDEALAADAPPSAETAGASKGPAAAPLPEQPGQHVAVSPAEATLSAALAPAAMPEAKKRGRSDSQAAPKAGAKAKKI